MFKRNKGKNQYHVYITTNTYRGMILEVGRHPNNESNVLWREQHIDQLCGTGYMCFSFKKECG